MTMRTNTEILKTMTPEQQKRLIDVMIRDLKFPDSRNNLNRVDVSFPDSTAYRIQLSMPVANADALIDNIENAQRKRAEYIDMMQRTEIERMFNHEQLFRFAYVPFVIAELVWDYADTVIIMAERNNDPATLKLSREIRKARAEYNRLRAEHIDSEHREREIENGYVFEDAINRITKQMLLNIRIDITSEYPDLNETSRELLTSVYQCHIMSRALLRYNERQTSMIEKRVGHHIGRILPPSYYVMDALIPEYFGDKPASPRFHSLMSQYIDTIATQMGLVILNDIEPEKTSNN